MSAAEILQMQKQQQQNIQNNPQAASKVLQFENTAVDDDWLSVSDIVKRHQTAVIMLPYLKKKVRIQSLAPGDQMNIYGSPINTMLSTAGIDPNDEVRKKTYLNNLSPNQIATLEEVRLRNFRRIAVRAIRSIQFRTKQQDLCEPGEASIWKISDADIYFIAQKVSELSKWDADAQQFQDRDDNVKAANTG